MSLSTLKPVAYRIPPVAGVNGTLSKVSKVTMRNRQAHPPFQVKGKENSGLQESLSITSRREMLHLTAASVGLLSLVLPASAEAGTRNATIRQKILEKFEELRQKVGLSKPKDEGEEKKLKDKTEGNGTKEAMPKPKDEGEEKKPKDKTEGKSNVENGIKEAKPKPKDEGEEKKPKDEKEAKAKVQNGVKAEAKDEKNHSSTALPGIINGKSVETTSLP